MKVIDGGMSSAVSALEAMRPRLNLSLNGAKRHRGADRGVADTAARVAEKGLDESGQPLGDLAAAHHLGRQDEEGYGEQRRVVDAADDLLHGDRIGQRAEEEALDHQRRDAQHQEHFEAEDQHGHGSDDDDGKQHQYSSAACSVKRSITPNRLSR